MTSDTEKLKNDVDAALNWIEVLERAKNPVPSPVKQILKAMKEGTELAMSAEEASLFRPTESGSDWPQKSQLIGVR